MLLETAGLVIVYNVIDKLVKKDTRWYFIHSVVNLGVLSGTYKDVYNMFTSDHPLLCEPTTQISTLNTLISSLHLYHLCCFDNLRLDDYLHHIIMIICFNLSILNVQGSYPGSFLFFMNGLPGFIDYNMLIFSKYNLISKITEKNINTYLNVYIRSPGIIFTLGSLLYHVKNKDFLFGMNFFFIFFNGQYYTRDVCINYGNRLKNGN